MRNKLVAPVLKWVGGKRQLLDVYNALLPSRYTAYYEPFLGGGAMLFHLQPKTAFINDINPELMQVYAAIKNNVEALILELETMKNTPEFFYSIRDWDRDKESYRFRTEIQKAARIVYLNKTCFNGLYRVNNAGEFNSPFGYYRNPNIVNAPVLRAVSRYFNSANISMTAADYTEALHSATKGAFVYLDPPYDPVSGTSNFTGYSKGGFSRDDQIRLRRYCDDLDRRGVKFMLSNSATPFILEQYGSYRITIVQAKRAINAVAAKRGEVDEVVICNYG